VVLGILSLVGHCVAIVIALLFSLRGTPGDLFVALIIGGLGILVSSIFGGAGLLCRGSQFGKALSFLGLLLGFVLLGFCMCSFFGLISYALHPNSPDAVRAR
jgi:hypothetical protein